MKFLYSISLIAGLLFIYSCDRPECSNSNPIFDKNPPESQAYKAELAKQLNAIDQSRLTHWLKKYEEIEGQDCLYFNIQGDDLCAQIILTAKQWDKLSPIVEAKAVSYRGALFTDLEYRIESEAGSTQFVFTGVGSIID